ncbi:MAG: class I SAM-dependent methyltransferase [bacterium]|nr:class I SAM-dependent methyltransferase [bacterium]
MTTKCNICGNEKNNSIIDVKERILKDKREVFHYMQCGRCGAVMLQDRIDDFAKWYPSDYNPYHKRKEKQSITSIIKRTIEFEQIIRMHGDGEREQFQKVLGGMKECDILLKRMFGTNIKRKNSLVDIGCGDGHWLDYLYEMGYHNITGVDLFTPEEQTKGVKWKFIKGDIFSLHERYDYVVLNHSFEHMDNPQAVIKQIKKIMNPNAICIISIPVANGMAYKKYKENFAQFDAPRHVYLHTKKSMEVLCNNAGLRIRNILYDSNGAIWQLSELMSNCDDTLEELYKKIRRNGCKKQYYSLASKSNIRGTGDQAIFYLTKNK